MTTSFNLIKDITITAAGSPVAGLLNFSGPEEEMAIQQVKVIGHQNPTIQKKSGFFPKLSQDLDKHPAEGLASKEATAAIGACGDELQLAALERASVDEHYNSIGRREGKRESQSWLALRQPAWEGTAIIATYLTLEETAPSLLQWVVSGSE